MSDLLPMLSGAPDEFETLLLRSADDDEPETDALERVGAALGVSASALALSSAGSAVAGHAAWAGNGVALGKHLTVVSLLKWLAVGVSAGFVTGGAAHWVSHEAPAAEGAAAPAMTAPTSVRAAAQPHEPARVAAALPADGEPSALVEAGPKAAPGGNAELAAPSLAPTAAASTPVLGPSSASFAPLEEARTVAGSPPAGAGAPASTLSDETRALDDVRASLALGRTAQALAGLEHYRATWPRGALAAEATLLRVDAWLRSGNRAAAQREADALISAAPQSRYASRARSLMQK